MERSLKQKIELNILKINKMRYLNITFPDVNNGLGCRVSLWVSGCTHHCKYCHNKNSWNFENGKIFDKDAELKLFNYVNLEYIKGITLTGGDPLDSYEDIIKLLYNFREKFGNKKDIWLYTGYYMSDIKEKFSKILELVDYIVDGPFEIDKKDTTLPFRGSSNQHIYKKLENNNFECITNI